MAFYTGVNRSLTVFPMLPSRTLCTLSISNTIVPNYPRYALTFGHGWTIPLYPIGKEEQVQTCSHTMQAHQRRQSTRRAPGYPDQKQTRTIGRFMWTQSKCKKCLLQPRRDLTSDRAWISTSHTCPGTISWLYSRVLGRIQNSKR